MARGMEELVQADRRGLAWSTNARPVRLRGMTHRAVAAPTMPEPVKRRRVKGPVHSGRPQDEALGSRHAYRLLILTRGLRRGHGGLR